MILSILLCIVSAPFCSSVLNALSVFLFLWQRCTRSTCSVWLPCSWISCLHLPSYFSIPVTWTCSSISVILINVEFLFRRVIYRHIGSVRRILNSWSAAVSTEIVMLLNSERFVECTDFLESRLRCPYVVSTAHDESWWDYADRIRRLRYEGHNSIIVFNYYQNHEGTLYYYCPNCVFLKSVFLLIASFFADIFASCVVSVSFEIRFLRVHPFSLDESFVSPCVSVLGNLMMSVVTKSSLQDFRKIRVTHRSFFELIYYLKNIDQTSTSNFSDRQILSSSRIFGPYQRELTWYHFCWCNDVTGWISVVILYES